MGRWAGQEAGRVVSGPRLRLCRHGARQVLQFRRQLALGGPQLRLGQGVQVCNNYLLVFVCNIILLFFYFLLFCHKDEPL